MIRKFLVKKIPPGAAFIVVGDGTYPLGAQAELNIQDLGEFERLKKDGYIAEFRKFRVVKEKVPLPGYVVLGYGTYQPGIDYDEQIADVEEFERLKKSGKIIEIGRE